MILLAAPEGTTSPRPLILLLGLLALGSFVGAIIGEGRSDPRERGRKRHGT